MIKRILSVLLALLLFAFPLLTACTADNEEPTVEPAPTFGSDEEHFTYAVNRFADRIREALENLAAPTALSGGERTQNVVLTVNIQQNILQILEAFVADVGQSLAFLDGSTVQTTISKSSQGLALQADLRLGSAKVLSAIASNDRDAHEILASVEPLVRGTVKINVENAEQWTQGNPLLESLFLFAAYAGGEDETLLPTFIDAEYGRLKALLPRFFGEAKKESAMLTVEGVTENFTAFKSVITPDAIFTVLSEWIDGAVKDEALERFARAEYPALLPLLRTYAAGLLAAGEDFEVFYGNLKNLAASLDERAEEIKKALPQIDVTAYTDAYGEVKGFDLEISYFDIVDTFTLRTAKSSDRFGLELTVKNRNIDGVLSFSGSLENGRITGTGKLESETLLVPFTLTNVSLKALECGRIDGRISLAPVDAVDLIDRIVGLGAIAGFKNYLAIFGDVYIEGSGFYNDQSLKIALSGPPKKDAPAEDLFALTFESSLSDSKADISPKTDGQPILSPDEFLEDMQKSREQFRQALVNAGLPEKLIDLFDYL